MSCSRRFCIWRLRTSSFQILSAALYPCTPRNSESTLLEGEMDFSVGQRTERMKAGDVIYLAPGARHALKAVTACRMQLVLVEVGQG